MARSKPHVLGSLLAALAAPAGFAGVVIQARLTDLKDQSVTKMTTLVEAERLRTDVADSTSDTSMILVRRDGDFQMILLDRRRKQYQVMDRAALRQMSQQLSSAMAQIQEQLKNLPPEQRAMMEKMMGKQAGQPGAAAAAPKTTFRAAGTGSVAGRPCKKYEAFEGTSKVAEVCAVAPQSLGLSAADMAVFEKLSEIFEEFTRAARQYLRTSNVKLADKQIDGFPIEYVSYQEGRPTARYEVLQVTPRSFSDADFSTGDAKLVASPWTRPGR